MSETKANLLLRNVRRIGENGAIDPSPCDVRIEDGKIAAIGPELVGNGLAELDLGGAAVVPGLFDLHVNLREPGGEDAETIASGSRAAAAGGFTAVAAMPSTPTPNDTRAVIDLIHERTRGTCGTKVHPVAAITKGLDGKQLTEMWELADTGAVAVSDDGHATASSEVLRRGMEYARMCGLPVLVHCDDADLRGRGVMHEGFVSTTLGLRGIPSACEEIVLARNLSIAALTGCRVHVQHVSSEGGVEMIRRAKERGLAVTAEVTAHHLTFTDEALREYDPRFKCNPPLREERDRAALRRGVMDGTIDVIVSDHFPHTRVATDVEFDRAPFGVAGLESTVSAAYAVLVEEEGWALGSFVRALSSRPREILGLSVPTLSVGECADLTVLDLAARRTIQAETFESRGRNCPFVGWSLPVAVRLTVSMGTVTFQEPVGSERGGTGTSAVAVGENQR
ncbi:MAG: dihydroorotase [Candidatus Eisenbacteria bacterium]